MFLLKIVLILGMAYIGLTIEKSMYFGAKKEIILLASELRNNMTRAEEILWSKLRRQELNGAIFRRQHPIDIFLVDFYCHKHKLVIEIDGGVHELSEVRERDENQTCELENFGLKVIRFTNDEVFFESEMVLQRIKQHLKV
jgi:very-short-patch-repair endonuclease